MDPEPAGLGDDGADGEARASVELDDVGSEHGEGVAVVGVDEPLDVVVGEAGFGFRRLDHGGLGLSRTRAARGPGGFRRDFPGVPRDFRGAGQN